MPKAIVPDQQFQHRELLGFDNSRWTKIKRKIPKKLTAKINAALRADIAECCSQFLTQRRQLQIGIETARAMRSPGKRQLAALEQVAKGSRMAADGWKRIKGKIYDDRLSDISRFDKFEALARDAERRLASIRALGKPVTVPDPWPMFVRKIAQCCREAGLKPKATGRVYEKDDSGKHADPTWFQEFMAVLNENLLGDEGRRKQLQHSRAAFYAEITKALRGDRKPGKARK
jgi:hypothetical protein